MSEEYSVHRCPVCKGRGKVNYGKQSCKSCETNGFIVIDNKSGRPVPTTEQEMELAERLYGK